MNSCTILVLSRYPDLFAGFRTNVDELAPETRKLLIRSGEEIFHVTRLWHSLHGPEPFVFARNVNFGMKMAGTDDVILVGDDVRFLTPGFVDRLREVAYSDEKIGTVVPKIDPTGGSIFICCYIRRDVIDAVGLLDERFDGYGFDDNDYYTRYEALGYHTHPISSVVVSHPISGTSFFRRQDMEGGPHVMDSCERMRQKFEEKWHKP